MFFGLFLGVLIGHYVIPDIKAYVVKRRAAIFEPESDSSKSDLHASLVLDESSREVRK